MKHIRLLNAFKKAVQKGSIIVIEDRSGSIKNKVVRAFDKDMKKLQRYINKRDATKVIDSKVKRKV